MDNTEKDVIQEKNDVDIAIDVKGAFAESLKRNNKQIRNDRAEVICEDAYMQYKREIEDLQLQVKKLRRAQENMLDLSPSDATSLKMASDFDAKEYVVKDQALAVKISEVELILNLSKARFLHLFGGVI